MGFDYAMVAAWHGHERVNFTKNHYANSTRLHPHARARTPRAVVPRRARTPRAAPSRTQSGGRARPPQLSELARELRCPLP